jgi:hypothetical protein
MLTAARQRLTHTRRVEDLDTVAALRPTAERRRRLAKLDLEFRAFCVARVARLCDPA